MARIILLIINVVLVVSVQGELISHKLGCKIVYLLFVIYY